MIPNVANTSNMPPAPGIPRAKAGDPAAFDALLASTKPRPEEVRWTAIPWQSDLWAARRPAAQHGRPIFLWAMNGKPFHMESLPNLLDQPARAALADQRPVGPERVGSLVT